MKEKNNLSILWAFFFGALVFFTLNSFLPEILESYSFDTIHYENDINEHLLAELSLKNDEILAQKYIICVYEHIYTLDAKQTKRFMMEAKEELERVGFWETLEAGIQE